MLPKWIITVYASGPIAAEKRFSIEKRKDIVSKHALHSKINVKNGHGGGLIIELEAYAKDEELAVNAAFTFLGYAIDILSFKIDLPISLSLYDLQQVQRKQFPVRREISVEEFESSFDEARLLRLTESYFLNAISWYRKGLISENPVDKFLAYWNSIEVLASNYHIKDEHTKKGIRNQIWSILHALYGEPDNWKLTDGNDFWIKEFAFWRQEIAHGSGEIGESEFIRNTVDLIDRLRKVSFVLLKDWRNNKLVPEAKLNDDLKTKLNPLNWLHFGEPPLN